MRVEVAPLHFFGCIIIRLKPHIRKHQFICRVNIRMSDVDTPVKYGRLAKNNVRLACLVFAFDEFQALKPNQIDHPGTIREMSNQPSLPSFAERLKTQYLPTQLDIRHIPVYLVDVIQPAAVYVFIREIIQQVLERTDIQFLLQNSSPLGTYTLQILYITQ